MGLTKGTDEQHFYETIPTNFQKYDLGPMT